MVLQDYIHAVTDGEVRVERLTKQIEELLPGWSMAPVVVALQAMRGVAFIVAVSRAEVGDFFAFENLRQLMAYLGLVPSELRAATRCAEAALPRPAICSRRALIEGAWTYRMQARVSRKLHDRIENVPQTVRDIAWKDPFHRCARCNYRQHIIPPFKRKDVSYTYRFEQFVLRSLIGSTAEEVARRLGISAETVDRIVENQLTEDRQIDPQRVITDIGLDELSLKKRHRLYVTLMTDLSDPTRPQILAVERGRDTTAALKCLDRLTQEQRQQVRTHRVDMGPAYPAACALRLPHSRAVTDRFHVAKKFNEVVDSLRKNITREYKAKLTKDQRKAFRSQMWAFRRDPESLSAEEKQALEALFEKIPALRPLYKVRLRFKEIFDTAHDRITAARWLRELRRECGQLGLDLGSFFETYDRWKTKILNYFDARQTSAAVEGINNKARVITKRTYGLKSAKSLWDRLILDLNRASQAIGYSIEHIRQMAKGLKALFDWSCT